jgi:hypothetical protein
MEEPEEKHDWLTTGILPKSGYSKEVSNYRPIKPLTIIYSTLTEITARKSSAHLEKQNLLPAEQKVCHLGCKGCKNHFMISKSIYEECKKRRNNLRIDWIDYQEAFECVPHSWVEKSTELIKAKSKIIRFR